MMELSERGANTSSGPDSGAVSLVQQWARRTHTPEQLAAADLYILAVSDGAIPEVSETLPFSPGSVVAHAAGSVDVAALSEKIAHRAVMWPLQTFTRGRRIADPRHTPFFIEGTTPHALHTVRTVAETLSDRVTEMPSERRARLHLAAAFAGNFSNAMLSLSEEIAVGADQTFDILRPLVAETFAKALALPSPRDAQSGPARRGDRTTMARHRAILAATAPHLATLYDEISTQIWNISKKN
jgi:predicted short-subunit dehydrogenase-like oxidoreductase (DUF2520 family)